MPISPQITITPETITTKNFAISAVSYTSSTATYTAVGHTFSTGDIVLISDLAPDGYNGTYTITGTATNTFTISNSTNATVTDAVGTAFWADPTEYSYEDLTAVYSANSDDLAKTVTDLTVSIDQKAQTYYQLTPPTSPPFKLNVGDIWFDTDDGNKQYRYDGSNWVSVQDGTIATKNKTYYSGTAPTGTFVVGDIWFDTNTGNKPYRWDGSAWISVQDASIASTLAVANAAQNTANGKNKVTYSASAPGSTANTAGDIWWQFSSGVIIGQWTGAGGTSWTSAPIGSAVIANLDAGKITAGTISVAISLEAATITGGSININNGNFVVTTAGAVSINAISTFNINSGTFQVSNLGSVTATSGTIGGWSLTSTKFASSGTNKVYLDSSTPSVSFTYGATAVAHIVPISTAGVVMHYGATADGTGASYPKVQITSSTAVLAGSTGNSISINTSGSNNMVGDMRFFNGVRVDGQLDAYGEIYASQAVSTSTSAATNCYITTGGLIRRTTNTSSARYKENITDIASVPGLDPKGLLKLPVRAFTYKEGHIPTTDDRYGQMLPGFIAEEVDAIYPIAVDYENGVETWNSFYIVPALLALIQDQDARIKALEGN